MIRLIYFWDNDSSALKNCLHYLRDPYTEYIEDLSKIDDLDAYYGMAYLNDVEIDAQRGADILNTLRQLSGHYPTFDHVVRYDDNRNINEEYIAYVEQ